jgi:hypothetical protein
MSSQMSINDVYRILHDHRHGVGSYERYNNSQYNYYVSNTHSFPSYGNNQYSGNNNNTSSSSYYMSSKYL